MTEQELNKRIAEILGSTKNEPGCGRRSGRQYRRTQCVRHSDHLLFLIQHSRYAPNMGYIKGDYERLRTLLHSGLHISVYEVQRSSTVSEAKIQSKGP